MVSVSLQESFVKKQIGIFQINNDIFYIEKSYFYKIDTSLFPDKSGAIHCSIPGSDADITECCFDQCIAYSMGAAFYLKTHKSSVQKSNSFGCITIFDIDSHSGIGGRLQSNESSLSLSAILKCSPHEKKTYRSSFAVYDSYAQIIDVNLTDSRTTTYGITMNSCAAGSGISYLNVVNQMGQCAAGFQSAVGSYLNKSNFVNNTKITISVFICSGSSNINVEECIFSKNSKKDITSSKTTTMIRCITDKYIWDCENTVECSNGVDCIVGPILRKYGCFFIRCISQNKYRRITNIHFCPIFVLVLYIFVI